MTTTDAAALVQPAPPTIRKVATGIDVALATAIFQMASTNPTGATNGVIYPSTEDEAYANDVKMWRKHLASRIDVSQRVKVVPFTVDGGVSFAVQIAAKVKRAAKSAK